MAKKTHYKATDRNGTVHTRSTESRAYTHVVLSRPSEAGYRAMAVSFTKQDAQNFAYYLGELGPSPKYHHDAAQLERIREQLMGCTDLESYRAAYIAKHLELHEKAVAAGRFEQFNAEGWCGSHELARRKAHSLRGKELIAEVLILEAVEV